MNTFILSATAVFAIVLAGPVRPTNAQGVVSSRDRAGIRDAYEAARHAAFAVPGGYEARDARQRWLTRFDGDGFTVTPDDGDWSWGLELARYGWGDEQRTATQPNTVSAQGNRVTYAWDAHLCEWYANDARGLEHGYVVHARPDAANGTLTLALAIRGGLHAVVAGDGRDVDFIGESDEAIVRYCGLSVVDAQGREVQAAWTAVDGELRLEVEDADASYPLTIDPIAQQAYAKASNPGANDQFGLSVSISGDTAVVGAFAEDSNATGVNGNQANNGASDSGAAYVFVRNGATWTQQAYLKPSKVLGAMWFGYTLAISGDTIVVGAHNESSFATGVNGNETNYIPAGATSGAAYVFVRNGTTWSQQAYLKASNAGVSQHFGYGVAIADDTIVVGSYAEDSNATGVNGNQADLSAGDSGAAYVFVRNGTTWSQQAYLKASNTEAGDWFGLAVAVSGDTVAVASYLEDSDGTSPFNNSMTNSGAVYVYARSGGVWTPQAFLKAGSPTLFTGGDQFGWSLAASGDTLVVGAPLEDGPATGVNGSQSSNAAPGAGAAYVYVRSGTTWFQQAYLKASNTGTGGDQFGTSVAIAGDAVVVGAITEDSNATGPNGNELDNSFASAGAAYVFVRNVATWSQVAYLKASNTGAGDEFGASVSISGDTVLVGANNEDSSAAGVNGNGADNSAANAGAAYMFDVDLGPWTDLGFALAGVHGNPLLVGTGPLTTGSAGSLMLSNAAGPNALAVLFISFSSAPTPLMGGTLVPFPFSIALSLTTAGSPGSIPLAWPAWPAGASGLSLYFQYAIQDAAAIQSASLSNALRADVP